MLTASQLKSKETPELTAKLLARWYSKTAETLSTNADLSAMWPLVEDLLDSLIAEFGISAAVFANNKGWTRADWTNFPNIWITRYAYDLDMKAGFLEYDCCKWVWNKLIPDWGTVRGRNTIAFILLHEYAHILNMESFDIHGCNYQDCLYRVVKWFVQTWLPTRASSMVKQ